jgi:hypothetical protein
MTALGKYGNRGSEGGSDRVTCGANEALPSTAKPTLSNLIFASPFEVSIVVTNPQLSPTPRAKSVKMGIDLDRHHVRDGHRSM